MNSVEPIRSRAKIEAIKAVLKGQDHPRDYLLFVLGINTALRIGDLLRLRVGDVLDRRGDIAESIYIREQKTGREATVKLNEPAREAIDYYRSKAGATDPGAPLFQSHRTPGKSLERVRTWELIQKWVGMVGLEGGRYGCHTLRKTWGYMARQKGIPIELIQAKLGHRSPEVTRRYIGISQDEINSVEEKVCL